jgi:hypothetical protein
MPYDPKITVKHAEYAPQDNKDRVHDDVELPSDRPILDEVTNKRLLRKIDLRLMPVVRLMLV